MANIEVADGGTKALNKDFVGVMGNNGCMLMGRSIYDTVLRFGETMWAYFDTPIIFGSHRKTLPNHQ